MFNKFNQNKITKEKAQKVRGGMAGCSCDEIADATASAIAHGNHDDASYWREQFRRHCL